MKNILITGIPRAGKSTLARRLFESLPNYNLIMEDTLCTAAEDVYKQCVVKNSNDEVVINISDMVNFSKLFCEKYLYYLNLFETCVGIIYESYCMPIDEIKKYQDRGYIVVILDCGKLTEEQIFNNIRKYDTPEERTYMLSDKVLLSEIREYAKFSEEYKQGHQKYGIKYIDTSYERDNKLNEAFEYIIKQIKGDK